VKNLVDTRFFTLRALCRETAQSSADPIGENASAYFSSGPLWRAACRKECKNLAGEKQQQSVLRLLLFL
jgi:hypothetical protein